MGIGSVTFTGRGETRLRFVQGQEIDLWLMKVIRRWETNLGPDQISVCVGLSVFLFSYSEVALTSTGSVFGHC